ncbi:MAG: hypothetical protein ABIB04_04570 [Patescibacteria group bacterium]
MEAITATKFSLKQGLSCYFKRLKKRIEKAGKFLSGKPYTVMTVLVVLIGVFGCVLPGLASGDVLAGIMNGVADAIFRPLAVFLCAILYMIAAMITGIVMILMHILINVAQYNTFVGARPVELGWPLVRDVVNMFFIVVLLVIAFSTIIGYEPFHYKAHLPKLLLMVVLINFSKTLIGVLIDFSQVITLTFVNGFKQAAFGNLVKGFEITKIMEVASPLRGIDISGNILLTLGKVFVTLLFAITVFSIIATIMLIMVIYFVVRIVMLWILLILSPIAFFALALPTKLQNAMKSLTQNWWKQLGAFLTGGPIVAFFLWLALATIQGAGKPYEGMYRSEAQEPNETFTIISSIASTENLTTLIVSIMLLLAGLKVAVDVSGEVSPKLGAIAGKIKAAGGPAGVMGRFAAKGASKAARFGAKTAMTAIQAKAGGSIGAAGSKLTGMAKTLESKKGAFGILARPAGARLGKLGATLSTTPGRAASLEGAQIKDLIKGQDPKDVRNALEGKIESGKNSNNEARENAAKIELAKLAANPSDFKNLSDSAKEEYFKKFGGDPKDPEVNAGADAYATAQARRIAGTNIEEGLKAAIAVGDSATIKELTDAMQKDPSKYSDLKDAVKDFSTQISDPARLLRERKPEAFADTGVTTAYFQSADLIDQKTGQFKQGYEDSDAYKEFVKQPQRKRYAEALEQKMESEGGRNEIMTLMAAGRDGARPEQKAAAENVRQIISLTDDGRMILANRAVNSAQAPSITGGKVEITNFDQLVGRLGGDMKEKFKEALRGAGLGENKAADFAKGFDRPLTEKQANFVAANPQAYVSPETDKGANLATLAQGQAMGISPPPSARGDVINYVTTDTKSQSETAKIQGAMAVANINTEVLQTPGPDRDDLIKSLEGKVDALGELYKSPDTGTKKKMEGVISEIHKAAEKTKASVKELGAQLPEIDQKLITLSDQIRKQDTLKQIGRRSNKGQRG